MTHHPNPLQSRQGALPHGDAPPDSPIFWLESKRLQYGQTQPKLVAFSQGRLFRFLAVATGLWALAVFAMINREESFTTLWVVLGWLFMASFLDKFVLDFMAVNAGLDSLRQDQHNSLFDLMSLTNLSSQEIIAAKFAIVQIRVWRMMVNVIAFRLTIIWVGFLTLFVLPVFLWNESQILNLYRDVQEAIFISLYLIAFAITAAIYVIEPRWRLRTLAAGSLAVSSQLLEPAFALLSAMGLIIGVWIMQIFMAVLAMVALSFFGFAFLTPLTVGFYIIVYVLGVGFVIRALYHSLARRWLNKAYRRMTHWGSVR